MTLFRPERWESIPEAATSIPGIWGNMLTFLGGQRACIGFRFSLVEYEFFLHPLLFHRLTLLVDLYRTKALLFTLVRAFEFQLAVPAEDIGKKSSIVQRPMLKSDPESRSQLPLHVTLYERAD